MIEIKNLFFQYESRDGSIRALDGVDLQIREGESVAIIGANGSGKTTLAWCINGLLQPSSGEVRVDGLSTNRPQEIWPIRRRVGMIFQNPDNQVVSTTVEREIAFGLENLGLSRLQMRRRVADALERFGLERYRHHAPHRLSGGEKQRLAIASVLAMQPKYLILDEPTSLLDPKGRSEVAQILKELRADRQVTTIHITQWPQEALEADRLIVMADGRIELDDTPSAVFSQGNRLRALGLEVPLSVQLKIMLEQQEFAIESLMAPEGCGLRQLLGSAWVRKQRRSGANNKIATERLSYVYNKDLPMERRALSDIDMDIKDGQFLALIGSAGSGKTTLVQHFNGLLKPTSGWVKVNGQDLWQKGTDLQKIRQEVGLVFQFPEFQLFEERVWEDVAFGPRNLGISEEQIDHRVRQALDLVGLDSDRFSQRSPLSLSEGEKRRAAIAGVLAMSPKAIILDEPTVGLDPRGTRQIAAILERLNSESRTIVLISHNMDLVAQLAEQAVVLADGKIAMSGSPEEIFSQPEFLESIGLDLPQRVQVINELKQMGLDVRTLAT